MRVDAQVDAGERRVDQQYGQANKVIVGTIRPMQVTQVTPFLVDSGGSKSWLFVKVETDEGVVGWGEAYTQADRDAAMLAHLTEMGRLLVGRTPFAIKHFSSVMYDDYALRRPEWTSGRR
jgi:L-alanine-DL-glutamate epimerase-like enolase superfamily enzyme